MDIKGGAVRPLPLYEDMKKLFAVFRVLGVLGIGVFRVVGGVGVLGVFGVLRVIHEIYLLFSCTLGTDIVSLRRREICKKILEKPVDKHAAVVYNTLENKEGRCIRLTSRISKEVNSVI